METVSVIIPVYNVEKYLPRCLDSVTGQTYKNLEIILVDDGSSDSSGTICDEYAARDDRVTVIHTENRGPAAARNTALDSAAGEYIMFMDSDDYVTADIVEFLYKNLKAQNADISMCGYYNAYDDGNIEPQEKVSFSGGKMTPDEFWKYFYTDIRIYYVVLWAKLYKKEMWADVHFPENKHLEDEFVTHLWMERCSVIAASAEPKYFYVQNNGSIMHAGYSEKNLYAAEAMLLRGEYFADKKNYTVSMDSLTMAMYSIVKGFGYLGCTPRVKELHKSFRLLYRRLIFKQCDLKKKLKCGVFYISIKLFSKAKTGGN